jgi:hypothetical protein
MAFTLNGTGTTFYGKRDFRADGSHITTEWLAFFYIPLIPIRSLRVISQGPGEHKWYLGVGHSSQFLIYEKTWPNWKQVLSVYGYLAMMIVWIYGVCVFVDGHFPHVLDGVWRIASVLVVFALPAPLPLILRYYAEKSAYERHNA